MGESCLSEHSFIKTEMGERMKKERERERERKRGREREREGEGGEE